MTIYKNIPLKKYNTFGLSYTAESMIHLKTEKEASKLFRKDDLNKKPLLILGAGSNILFTSDFNGMILKAEFEGIRIEDQNEDSVIISAGAGVIWDNLVEWTVSNSFQGLENLSMIPGTVGASPVQNIGAYGVEVKDFIEKVSAICIADGSERLFSNSDCTFAYRNSFFKNAGKGKYLVTRVYYKLTVIPALNLSYGSLKEEVAKLGNETLRNVRQAVINIRSSKLPNPDLLGNAGSFFKNPVVTCATAESLKVRYPQIPMYEEQEGFMKLAAGWLIDKCGWKGRRNGDAGVHDKQALVIVNYGNATGKEIYQLSESIKKSVYDEFGIELSREVEVVGSI